ncbi:MAG: A24 family peptidase C-terminal domain-containing protein [Thermoplasmata archaeon]
MLLPAPTALFDLRVVILVGGLAFAAYQDLKIREVADGLWQATGLIGAAAGFIQFWGDPLALVLWALVSIWALEHLFAWDTPLDRYSDRLPGWIELGVYIGVLATVIVCALKFGVGGSGVPVEVIAVAAAILLARGLFEIGVLYGGADAKALMIAGLLLPIDATPLWSPPVAAALLAYYPFALTVLIDAALFAIVVPIAIAIRNLTAHEFTFPRGFTGYTIPVAELPDRYVWIKDPTFAGVASDDEHEPQTTEEDRALRQRQADELAKQGVERVWVTPQLPFILWILAGTVAALVAGNLIFDLLTAL